MTIYFATDHAGYELKNELVRFVRDELGHAVEDCGAHTYDASDDYPLFISLAAVKVSADPENHRAVILGGSGQGEAMVANRYRGVRAAVYYGGEKAIIELSREHNDANILALGARFIDAKTAKDAVGLWLGTPFSNEERHKRRVRLIDSP